MKEVLILSYFYPPCTLTAAQRPSGWVKYLHEFGYRPTVVTRSWEREIRTPEDQLKDSGSEILINAFEQYEIHTLPYKASFRDQLFNSSHKVVKKTSKILTFINAVGENFSNRFIPFANLYDYATELIKERDFSCLIITGNPFIQFRFGYLLHKKYNIPWIADYRDDWTTSEIILPQNKLLFSIHQYFERKWCSSSSLITSISPVYTGRISSFLQVEGKTIYNGFDQLQLKSNSFDTSCFTITYNGTLYDTQDVEGFLEVIKKCIDTYNHRIHLQINFPGSAYDTKQLKRLQVQIKGYESHFFISNRLPKDEVIEMQMKTDLLVMLTHRGMKGIPSSKLYEYLSFKKPILCFPSDNDIVAETLSLSRLGIIANDIDSLYKNLCFCVEKKILQDYAFFDRKDSSVESYTIKSQTAQLASIFESV